MDKDHRSCSECFVEVRLHSRRERALSLPVQWTPQRCQGEGCEDQDDSNIHCQPFPEPVSEEHNIYTDDDGYHRDRVKHVSYLSAHVTQWFHGNSHQAQERIAGTA
jgi:hypothetical protein